MILAAAILIVVGWLVQFVGRNRASVPSEAALMRGTIIMVAGAILLAVGLVKGG